MSTSAQFYLPSTPAPDAGSGGAATDPDVSQQVGGGCGAGPFGGMPCGSGGGIDIEDAEQIATNAIRVTIAGNVPILNRGDVRDALYDRGWTLDAPNDPGVFIPRVIWAERESSTTVILYLDALLEGPGHAYRVIASEQLVGTSRPQSSRSAMFRTFGEAKAPRPNATKKSFDLANVAPGVLGVDADGDYTNDAAFATRKKRVIRRLTTSKGAFAHLPDYGLRLPIKRLYTVGDLRALQADALEQVREEGILDAQVAISTPTPGVVLLVVTGTGLGDEGVDVEIRPPS